MLNTAQAETAVLTLLDNMATRTDSTPAGLQAARQDFAHGLVAAIAGLIRTGTVTGTVSTTGTAAAQAGTITTSTIA